MKAIVCTRYGPPEALQLQEVEKPAPKDDQVLIKVHASTVTAGDCQLQSLRFPLLWQLILRIGFGFKRPRKGILGQELAGEVESVGKEVRLFKKGDQVFGWTGLGLGAYAEYTCLPEHGVLAKKPSNMNYDEAATLPVGGLDAVYFLRRANIQKGQKVLIQGASGGVGTFAVQIAKSFGAHVTAVCSTRNVDTARSIGADEVIDYTREDFTRNGQQYDLILAVNGYHPILDYKRSLSPQGIYVMAGGSMAQIFQAMVLGPLISRSGGQKMGLMGIARINQTDLVCVRDLLQAGKVVPVIDRRYPLAEVADALRYLAEGHARGKVVITVDQR